MRAMVLLLEFLIHVMVYPRRWRRLMAAVVSEKPKAHTDSTGRQCVSYRKLSPEQNRALRDYIGGIKADFEESPTTVLLRMRDEREKRTQ